MKDSLISEFFVGDMKGWWLLEVRVKQSVELHKIEDVECPQENTIYRKGVVQLQWHRLPQRLQRLVCAW